MTYSGQYTQQGWRAFRRAVVRGIHWTTEGLENAVTLGDRARRQMRASYDAERTAEYRRLVRANNAIKGGQS